MLIMIVALDAEARPLVKQFKLKRLRSFNAFPMYVGNDLALSVCGIGSDNAKIVTSATLGYWQASLAGANTDSSQEIACLNIGIAGHQEKKIGSCVLAHKVSQEPLDPDVRVQNYFPFWPGQWPCDTAEIQTVSTPVKDYKKDIVHEMEAVGFCQAALRFSSVELVHVFKVISDNHLNPISAKPDKDFVASLLAANVDQLQQLVDTMQQTVQQLNQLHAMPQSYEIVLAHYKTSVTQQNQLRQLLRRWQALVQQDAEQIVDPDKYSSIKHWMHAASDYLDKLPVEL